MTFFITLKFELSFCCMNIPVIDTQPYLFAVDSDYSLFIQAYVSVNIIYTILALPFEKTKTVTI